LFDGANPKNYVLNGGGPIETIDGNRTPPHKDPYSKTQKDKIYIHRTNNDGTASWGFNKQGIETAVSFGCLLIKKSQWNEFENQLGHNSFRVILQRK
jgi:hypothetical protein